MIVEYIRYTLAADRVASFQPAYERAAASLRASQHCLGYELAQCNDAPDSFILRILWDSERGHVEGFRTSPQFKTFLPEIQPFIPDIAEMRHYTTTSLAWTRS